MMQDDETGQRPFAGLRGETLGRRALPSAPITALGSQQPIAA